MSISSPPTTASTTENNDDPTKGLKAWEARRKAWLTPNESYLQKGHHEGSQSASPPFEQFLQSETQRLHVYRQLVTQRHALRQTLPLKYIIPCLVTGWQDDGLWPKGMIVRDAASD